MSDPFLQEIPEVEGGDTPGPIRGDTLQFNVVSDESKPKEWESRGTVLGVCISVLATSGSHIAYLSAMFALMKTSEDRLLSCEHGEGIGWGRTGRFFCDYTKAYLQCFPELALTICLLLIGRNLLQTRMYYGMLQRGSVLQYKSKNLFNDNLMRFFLWCYAHAIAHLLLLMYIIWKGGVGDDFFEELKETKGGRQKHSEQFFLGLSHRGFQAPDNIHHPLHNEELKNDVSILVELVGFFVIPSTLFLIFLFTGYDIEASLVPLSQYFYDARQGVHGWSARACCELTVMDDDAVKLLVEHHQDHIHDVAETVTEAYDELIKLYVVEGQMWESKARSSGQTFIGISQALWPARLLISEDATDNSSWVFRAVWMAFIVISLCLQLFMMLSLSHLVTQDLAEARTRRSPLWHLGVVVANICVEVFGIMVNVHSFTQWVRHDWLRRRGHEKNWKRRPGGQSCTPGTAVDKPSPPA